VFYLLSLALVLLVFRYDLKVTATESSLMIGLYFAFLLLLYLTRNLCPLKFVARIDGEIAPEQFVKFRASDIESDQEIRGLTHEQEYEDRATGDENADDPDDKLYGVKEQKARENSYCSGFLNIVNMPTAFLYSWTIPDCSNPACSHWYPLSFLMSLVYVSGISFGLMTVVQFLGCVLGFDQALSGLLILAVGASLPDAVAMGTVGRRGYGAMALGGLVGSNIFDILMGLGVPWFVANILRGPVVLTSHKVLKGIIFAVAAVFGGAISLWWTRFELKPRAAVLPVLIYAAYLCVELLV
jgi:Ca2+/Na+ antiporter